jgi:steroid delta-isomerase
VAVMPLKVVAEDSAEAAIRSALAQWTHDFNGGNAEKACALFAPDLRYDFRSYPERDYRDICDRMQRSLGDKSKSYSYDLEVHEILVSGDIAVVRLVWKLTVTLPNDQQVVSIEPCMDVFRRSRTAPRGSSATSQGARAPGRAIAMSFGCRSFPRSEFCLQKTGGVHES